MSEWLAAVRSAWEEGGGRVLEGGEEGMWRRGCHCMGLGAGKGGYIGLGGGGASSWCTLWQRPAGCLWCGDAELCSSPRPPYMAETLADTAFFSGAGLVTCGRRAGSSISAISGSKAGWQAALAEARQAGQRCCPQRALGSAPRKPAGQRPRPRSRQPPPRPQRRAGAPPPQRRPGPHQPAAGGEGAGAGRSVT